MTSFLLFVTQLIIYLSTKGFTAVLTNPLIDSLLSLIFVIKCLSDYSFRFRIFRDSSDISITLVAIVIQTINKALAIMVGIVVAVAAIAEVVVVVVTKTNCTSNYKNVDFVHQIMNVVARLQAVYSMTIQTALI